MANDYINKVKYGDRVLIDLTGDTVTRNDVLSSKTFHLPSGESVSGGMAEQGTHNWILDDVADFPISVTGGHYNNSSITIDSTSLSRLVPGNIKKDIEILGVTGTYQGTWSTGAPVTVTPAATAQVITPASQGVDCFTEVDVNAILYIETDNVSGGKTVQIASTVHKIRAGTYVSKTDISNFVEATFNMTYTVDSVTVSDMKIRYREGLWAIGYTTPGDTTTTVFMLGYPTSAPTEWTFLVSASSFHVDADTVVTQSQQTIFNSYFRRTGA